MSKAVIMWTVGLILSFAGFITAAYFGQDILFPAREKAAPKLRKRATVADSLSPGKVDSLLLVIEELMQQLEAHVEKTHELEQTIAARDAQLAEWQARAKVMQASSDSLRQRIRDIKESEVKVEDLTKTLGSMKTEVLRPILGKLSEAAIQILYDRANTRDKQKIFAALPPERAGQILKNMTKTLN